jgi:catalase
VNDVATIPDAMWTDEPDQPAVRASLAHRVGIQQRKIAAAVAELRGRPDRGQHQKQLLGGFGVLRIYRELPREASQGPFAAPHEYRVACRISNGQPCAFSDHAPDVRGVALKFFAKGGVETDLVMTNEGGRSHARNASLFMKIADLLTDVAVLQAGSVRGLGYVVLDALRSPRGLRETTRVAAILWRATVLHRVESMATEHYWGSVVQLGQLPAKYSLRPDESTSPGTAARFDSPNYLREDLVSRLVKGPLRFELCVQLFISEKRTPVNDASVIWDAPQIPVGRVEIGTIPDDAEEEVVNKMSFNPSRGFPPLGITHTRGDVYAASALNRGALSTQDIRAYFDGG